MDIRVFLLNVVCDTEPGLGSDFLVAIHRSLTQPFALICDLPLNCGIRGLDAAPGLLPYLWDAHFLRGATSSAGVCWILQDRADTFHRIRPPVALPLDDSDWGKLRFEALGSAQALTDTCGPVAGYALAAVQRYIAAIAPITPLPHTAGPNAIRCARHTTV